MHERAVCSVCESWAYLGVCVRDPGQHQPPFASCPLPLPGVPAYPAAANPHFARASLPPCLPCPKKTCLYSCDDVLCRIRGFPCIAFRSCVDCHAKVFFPSWVSLSSLPTIPFCSSGIAVPLCSFRGFALKSKFPCFIFSPCDSFSPVTAFSAFFFLFPSHPAVLHLPKSDCLWEHLLWGHFTYTSLLISLGYLASLVILYSFSSFACLPAKKFLSPCHWTHSVVLLYQLPCRWKSQLKLPRTLYTVSTNYYFNKVWIICISISCTLADIRCRTDSCPTYVSCS